MTTSNARPTQHLLLQCVQTYCEQNIASEAAAPHVQSMQRGQRSTRLTSKVILGGSSAGVTAMVRSSTAVLLSLLRHPTLPMSSTVTLTNSLLRPGVYSRGHPSSPKGLPACGTSLLNPASACGHVPSQCREPRATNHALPILNVEAREAVRRL